MSDLQKHAEIELRLAGLFDEDSDYGGMLGGAALEIVKVFSKQGHSGASASMVTGLVERLMRFEPLTALTGEDGEWIEVSDGIFQNKRCSHVFKENGNAYDQQGRIFREPDGFTYTSRESRVDIKFPYTPTQEYVDVPKQEG